LRVGHGRQAKQIARRVLAGDAAELPRVLAGLQRPVAIAMVAGPMVKRFTLGMIVLPLSVARGDMTNCARTS
jgi:hypothetical protein